MRGLSGTDCTQAIDPKVCVAAYIDYNMCTTTACVNLMHCQFPGTKASQDAACSSSQVARVHVDAWPSWQNWPPGIAVWMN